MALMVSQQLSVEVLRALLVLAHLALYLLRLVVARQANRRRSGEGPGRSHLVAALRTSFCADPAAAEGVVLSAVPNMLLLLLLYRFWLIKQYQQQTSSSRLTFCYMSRERYNSVVERGGII